MCDPTVGRQVRHGRGERNGGRRSWSAPWSDNAIYAPGKAQAGRDRQTGVRAANGAQGGLAASEIRGASVGDAGKQDTKVKWVRDRGSRWESAPRRTSGGGTLG